MSRNGSSRGSVRLADFDLFRSLSSAALSRAESLLTEVRIPAGRLLCEQGDVGREAFFIRSGSAVVIRDGYGVATVDPGDVVGEGALLGDGRRSATVRTTEPVTALVMNVREFLSLLELPGVGEQVREIAERRAGAESVAGAA